MAIKIYTHQNLTLVGNASNLLQQAGISCEIRNQYTGGATGELSFVETWPELWINEQDLNQATQVLSTLGDDATARDWRCGKCGEENGGSFELCWQCGQAPHPDTYKQER